MAKIKRKSLPYTYIFMFSTMFKIVSNAHETLTFYLYSKKKEVNCISIFLHFLVWHDFPKTSKVLTNKHRPQPQEFWLVLLALPESCLKVGGRRSQRETPFLFHLGPSLLFFLVIETIICPRHNLTLQLQKNFFCTVLAPFW